ncbi:hypothetical protein, partial [Agrobacterium pusense]
AKRIKNLLITSLGPADKKGPPKAAFCSLRQNLRKTPSASLTGDKLLRNLLRQRSVVAKATT